ncbi:hypothetical protein RchiOBHm_Chr2g0136701 [Rosa chinensis]|uniref:Uncharacterized protein n=1 Tax=Rosa chinensis TaxID=74649 RepID=A0A2P6RWE9_ROSCH|nr:hypothetical protein RchiOBHm_Chr2g0136701 [Rosa chinensis]
MDCGWIVKDFRTLDENTNGNLEKTTSHVQLCRSRRRRSYRAPLNFLTRLSKPKNPVVEPTRSEWWQ